MSSLKDDASLIMIPSLYKDGRLDTIKPLGNSILHPDATGTYDGTDGSTPPESNFVFSRGSNLAATRVDVNGLIEKGRENLILQSNQFDTTWSENYLVRTSGQAGYDGSNNAWKLQGFSGTAEKRIRQSTTTTGIVTLSVYAKAGTIDFLWLRGVTSSINVRTFFNLSNGTIGGDAAVASKITSVGNGWYRCEATFNQQAGFEHYIGITDADGSAVTSSTGYIFIQDAQLEQGLVATDYIETGASTAQAGILEDMPRLDYSGGASCPSLLLEPQRSNLLANSEYFLSGSGWSSGNINLEANSDTSPEGVQNATKIIPTTDNVVHSLYKTSEQHTDHIYSAFVKADGYNWVLLTSHASSAPKARGAFFYIADDGTATEDRIGTTGVGIVADIEDYGNGWFRISIDDGNSPSSLFTIIPSNTDDVESFSGDGTSGILVYGLQRELGSYPTSYIPTYGSSVTRSADVSTLGSLQSNEILNGATGTLLFEGIKNGEPIFSNFVITANNNTNKSLLVDNSAGGIRLRAFNASSGELTLTTSAVSDGAFKYLIRWDNGDLKVFLNGASVGTATISAYEYLSTNLREGSWSNNSIKQFLIFPTALTDSECIALTTL